MIYNKTTQRLKSRSRHNPHDEWIRAKDAFPAIVDRKLFDSAQAILKAAEEAHRIKYSDEDMLNRLRSLYEQYGTIRTSLIKATSDMVPPATYVHRFSSIFESYQGLYSEVIEDRRARVVKDLKERIPDTQEYGDFVVLRDYVSIRILPVVQFPKGYEAAWSFTPDQRPEIDITLGVPLTNGGKYDILGYLFFPRLMLGGREVRIATTMADKLQLHAYTLSQALETLIGMEVTP